MLCPSCGGGGTVEHSFSITIADDGAILYNCYRATCGLSGRIVDSAVRTEITCKKSIVRTYEYPIAELSEEQYQYLHGKFQLNKLDVDAGEVKFNPTRGSYVLPVFNMFGYQIGVNDRVFNSERKPKAILYWFYDNHPRMSFYIRQKLEGTLLLVEDQISAIKCSRFINTAALLGSNLSEVDARQLTHHYRNIIFWLDEDAISKAVAMRNRYSLWFNNIGIIHTEEDPKDTSYEAIEHLIQEQLHNS